MNKDEIRIWTLYLLECPVTGEVRYVGITSRKNVRDRLKEHIKEALFQVASRSSIDKAYGKYHISGEKAKWIINLHIKDLKPIIIPVACIKGTMRQAEKVESEYIIESFKKGYNLLNKNYVYDNMDWSQEADASISDCGSLQVAAT